MQQRIDGEGRVQLGLEGVFLWRRGVPGVRRGRYRADGASRGLGRQLVVLKDVRGQVLCENGLILARHCRVLPLEELQGNSAQLHGPVVAFAVWLARIFQHLQAVEAMSSVDGLHPVTQDYTKSSKPSLNFTYLDKAVVGGEVVPHRISPSLVVSFEEREQSADLLQNLKQDRKCFLIVFILTTVKVPRK